MSVTAYEAHLPAPDADALVRRHAELVKRIAYHLAGRLPSSVEVADLIQAGMLGLLEAAANYTADRGASFETYAGIRIRGAMLDALRKLDWAPRSVHRKARAAAAAMRELEGETGREAQDDEVAGRMGVSLDEYYKVVQDAASCRLVSLNDSGNDDESPLTRAADDSADPFREIADADFRKALVLAIDELPEREKLVMSLYYDDELNLKEIGAVLKVTESRVCQLHGQALVRLKARLTEWRETRDLQDDQDGKGSDKKGSAERRKRRSVATRV
jgi:RNA polymerase sigma factor for flagellar operon FliA